MNFSLLFLTAFLIVVNCVATDVAFPSSCRTNRDCRPKRICIGKNCPPVKICVDGKCKKKSNFETCGPNFCIKQKKEFCCNASCGICVPDGGQCIDIACDTCKKDSDCPTINCITTPCPQYECEKNICELKEIEEVPCGKNVCTGGAVCCNPSCGICTPPDFACIQIACIDEDVPCGKNICTGGDVCCNESCGTCTPPGDDCMQMLCVEEDYCKTDKDCTPYICRACTPNVQPRFCKENQCVLP